MFCIPEEDRHGAHAAQGYASHLLCRVPLIRAVEPGAPEGCDLEVDRGV